MAKKHRSRCGNGGLLEPRGLKFPNLRKAQSYLRTRRTLRSALFFLVEIERRGIDAIAQSRWSGAVVEHVPQVRAAAAAGDFRTTHPVRIVSRLGDGLRSRRVIKTRPSAARMKLSFRTEQFLPTTHALIRSGCFGPFILTGKGWLCPLLTGYIVLIWRELLFPFRVRFLYPVCHSIPLYASAIFSPVSDSAHGLDVSASKPNDKNELASVRVQTAYAQPDRSPICPTAP
jgi:hypothetical protein